MRVLHLFSNYKWTGPAEPALNLCLALGRLGVDVEFACGRGPATGANKIVETARDRGLEPLPQFHLSKHRHPIKDFLDRRSLRALLEAGGFDLVHCHMDNDHRIAAGPARRQGVPLVRSSYEGSGFAEGGLGAGANRAKVLAGTRFLLEPSQLALDHDAGRYEFPRDRMAVIPGAVDTARFDPVRETPDGRRWLGIPPDAFVIGIVARMQTHRHFDDFWGAVRRLAEKDKAIHVIVVGRGTHQEKVGKTPAQETGVAENVHFPGYLEGEDYVGMVKAFDVKVFLTPGTDGTCRAVREAMAMAKPIVVADRGMLAEIVDEGKTGHVFDGTAEGLHDAVFPLTQDRRLARALGHAAREKALESFSLEVQGKSVLSAYEAIANGGA